MILASQPIKTAIVLRAWLGTAQLFKYSQLRRTVELCQRAGIEKFIFDCPPEKEDVVLNSLGDKAELLRDSLTDLSDGSYETLYKQLGDSPCLVLTGNVVFLSSDLRALITAYVAQGREGAELFIYEAHENARFAVGPVNIVLEQPRLLAVVRVPGPTPFSLTNTDRQTLRRAERKLAQALRKETIQTDTFIARTIDRRLSWPISLVLARTSITPNQVTIFNTLVGLVSAVLLGTGSYWARVFGGGIFVASIIADGIDGELARLKFEESEAGERLDHITDNVVHVAIFLGIAAQAYRKGMPHIAATLITLLIGFALCAYAIIRSRQKLGKFAAEQWISTLERFTGRDFAYLVLLLAIVDKLEYFLPGAALGTFVAATVFWMLPSFYSSTQAPGEEGPKTQLARTKESYEA